MLNVLSTAGASVLAVGYAIPMIYFAWSLRYGKVAAPILGRDRPGMADGLAAAGPQFRQTPVVTREAYDTARWRGGGRSWLASSRSKPALREQFDTEAQQKDASTLGMWIFLITEVMFFGGMFAAYTVYRRAYPDAFAVASSA